MFIGSADGYFYALNSRNGTLNWKFQTGNIIDSAACVLDNGGVAVPSGDGNIYMLNTTKSGSIEWNFSAHC